MKQGMSLFKTIEPEKTFSEKLLFKFLNKGDHNISSFNSFLERGIKEIMTNNYRIIENDGIEIKYFFDNITYESPNYIISKTNYPLYPAKARKDYLTYEMTIKADLFKSEKDENGNWSERELEQSNTTITKLPIMVGCSVCNLIKNGIPKTKYEEYGEDSTETGGYFIIKGKEKKLNMQEQLILDRILINDSKRYKANIDSEVSVRILTSNIKSGTHLTNIVRYEGVKSKSSNPKPNNVYLLKSNRNPKILKTKQVVILDKKDLVSHVNICYIFNILGVETNDITKNIIRFVDDKHKLTAKSYFYANTIMHYKKSYNKKSSFETNFFKEYYQNNLTEQLEFVNKSTNDDNFEKEAMEIIKQGILPNIDDIKSKIIKDGDDVETINEKIRKIKVNTLCTMCAFLIEYDLNVRKADNLNSWSNKILRTPGFLYSELFRASWNTVMKSNDKLQAENKFDFNLIYNNFIDSFTGIKWGPKNGKRRENISEDLETNSLLSKISHLKLGNVEIDRKTRNTEIRAVQQTQQGFICPTYTPEGKNCGLLKNVTLLANITTVDLDTIWELLDAIEYNVDNKTEDKECVLSINSIILGWCNCEKVRDYLYNLRKNRQIIDTSIVTPNKNWIFLDNTQSQLSRPVLVVRNNKLLYEKEGEDILKLSADEMIEKGYVQYITPLEQETSKIAENKDNLLELDEKRKKAKEDFETFKNLDLEEASKEEIKNYEKIIKRYNKVSKLSNYDYCDICEIVQYSVAAAFIPRADYNQAPRNTYQVAMGKQALHVFNDNIPLRMDINSKFASSSENALTVPVLGDYYGMSKKGYGNNILTIFNAHKNTEEDAFVVGKQVLDLGVFTHSKVILKKSIQTSNSNKRISIKRPDITTMSIKNRMKYLFICNNGLPMVGSFLTPGDCVIGIIANSEGTVQNKSIFMDKGEYGIVENVKYISSENVVHVKIRCTIRLNKGDKLAPRMAQKGTAGEIKAYCDMPYYQKTGEPIGLITNTTQLPSRMTMSFPMEMISSNLAALKCKRVHAGPHTKFDYDENDKDILERYGYGRNNYSNIIYGKTGKKYMEKQFGGLVLYQQLKHHAEDKAQARGTGTRNPANNQPNRGKTRGGGIRFGEMEKDAIIHYGSSEFLYERLCGLADKFEVAICLNCGEYTYYNEIEKTYKCNFCDEGENMNIGRKSICFTTKLFKDYLTQGMIKMENNYKSLEDYYNEKEEVIDEDYDEVEEVEEVEDDYDYDEFYD